MHRKIKLSLFPIMTIFLYHTAIIKITYIDSYNTIALTLGICVLIYLLTKKIFLNKSYAKINITLLFFAMIYLFTSLYNSANFDGTILFILKVILLFLFLEYAHKTNTTKKVAKILFILNVIYLSLTYISILRDPLISWKNEFNYIIGAKFTVSYISIATLALYNFVYQEEFRKKNMYKVIGILLCIASIHISQTVKCSTGLFGNFIFIFIQLFNFKKIKKFISKPINIIIIFVISCSVLMIFYRTLVNIPIIKYVVEEVLNRNLTLTGRMYVYDNIIPFLEKNFFLGYGYNSVYSLFDNVMYIGNNSYALTAQNAILEYWLYSGFIGVVNLFSIMYYALKNNYTYCLISNKNNYYPFIVGLITLIILGMVEITVNMYFFMFLAFLNVQNRKGETKYENSNFVNAENR